MSLLSLSSCQKNFWTKKCQIYCEILDTVKAVLVGIVRTQWGSQKRADCKGGSFSWFGHCIVHPFAQCRIYYSKSIAVTWGLLTIFLGIQDKFRWLDTFNAWQHILHRQLRLVELHIPLLQQNINPYHHLLAKVRFLPRGASHGLWWLDVTT